MRHLNDGTLRRLYDEPAALAESARAHYAGCETCRQRFNVVAADARLAGGILAQAVPHVDAAAAFHRTRAVRDAVARPGRLAGLLAALTPRRVILRPLAAAVLATGLLATLVVTGVAQNLINLIQPSQVAVLPISTSDLRALPDISKFGTMQMTNGHAVTVTDAAGAAAAAGFSAPTVTLPAGIGGAARYTVMPTSTGSFTFSAAMARAEAAREGKTIPDMPAGMDGSTLVVTLGPAILQTYGMPTGGDTAQVGSVLAIGKMRAPLVQSTGVTLSQLEDYLASMPGVSASLAAQIRAIGDPSSTLPIPVPVDRATSKQVDVQGVKGVFIGDSTGLGSGVIWIKGGYVYGVAGTYTEDQILAVAGSLK